jgi:hypothetical protein
MTRLIKIILVLALLGLGFVIAELKAAPEGFEDENGFHKK